MNDSGLSNLPPHSLAFKLIRQCDEYGFNLHEVIKIVQTAPRRYKEYDIPKKHKAGKRRIAHPSAELKLLQRWIIANYLDALPVHPAAMAYEPNTSIQKNAAAHAKHNYLMKLDFQDFFPSIKPKDLIELLDRHKIKLINPDKIMLSQLLFWKPKKSTQLQLSIGAPSSPKVSNLVLYHFDEIISQYCISNKITYTRFADDMTFSTNIPLILEKCLKFVRKTLKEIKSPRLKLHEDKIVFSSKKYNRRVTGLVLTNEGKVSLGHEKKREIRAAIHHFMHGKLSAPDAQKLRGTLGYAHAVEPAFIKRMCKKYGNSVIDQIKSYEPEITTLEEY